MQNNIHSSIIIIAKNSKQHRCPLKVVMDEYIMVYLFNWILYNNENEWASATFNNVDEFHIYNVEQKNPDKNKYILYGSVSVKSKKQSESLMIDVRVVDTLSEEGRTQVAFWDAGKVLFF